MKTKLHQDTIDWYNLNSKEFSDSSDKVFHSDMIDEFTRCISDKNARVLDVGCGNGRDSGALDEKGFVVVGLDASKKLLEIARKKYPKVEFVEGNFLELPFQDESFDAIWAHASLLHVENHDQAVQAISECSRILKSGGVLHLLVSPLKKEETEKTVYFRNGFFDRVNKQKERVFYRFEMDELKKILVDLNF